MKLQNKIPLFVVVVMLLVGTIGGLALLSSQHSASTHLFEDTASALTAAVRDSLEHDMLSGDRGHIQESLTNLRQNASIKRIDIISPDNSIRASSDTSLIGSSADSESGRLMNSADNQIVYGDPSSDFMTSINVIPAKDTCLACHNGQTADPPNPQNNLGAIRIDISTASLEESLTKTREILLIVGGLTFLLVAATLVWMLRGLALLPLSRLTKAAGRISEGDYSARVPVKNSNDEISSVSRAFNEMVDTVEEHTRRLEEANRELARTSRMKSEFLANMSHELRTPLNVIIGFSEVLKDTPTEKLSEADRIEFCENIVSSGHHLLELINDVLDLAKVEAGQMNLTPEEFYVSTVIKEVINTMRPLADKKKISLSVRVSSHLSSIFADSGKFKQILYNLIGNAVKFTPRGGTVGISASMMGHFARFAVTDTGVGIAPDDQERIFSEFQQADGSTSRQFEGTGLGLALTKKFVEMQGGKIWVESDLGLGSTFYFTLPLPDEKALPGVSPAERDVVPESFFDDEQYEREESGEPELSFNSADAYATVSTDGATPKILVVEDDPKTAELIGLWLAQEGYVVEFALDGNEAVEKARVIRPFAMCLDIMLPRKDGWQVLHQLKNDPETVDIGVIICSALDNPQLGFALGAADYCVKPLSRRPLLDKLRHLQEVSPAKRSKPQVLVADGDIRSAGQTSSILERQGFSVISAANGESVKEMALEQNPDIIILDLMLPGAGIQDIIAFLRKHPVTVDIPVIVTSAREMTGEEEGLLLRQHVEKVIQQDMGSRELLLAEMFRLEKLHPERALLIDRETKLFNRRYFEKRLAEELSRASRYSLDLTILMIEVDSSINEAYSRNEALTALAGMLRSHIRAADPLARFDTNAFSVLLPETSREAGFQVAKKVVDIVRQHDFGDGTSGPLKLTVSVAVADSPHGGRKADELIDKLIKTIHDIQDRDGDAAQISE